MPLARGLERASRAPRMSAMAEVEQPTDVVDEVDEAGEVEAAPPPLDPETRARGEAALAHVRQYGDPVLRAEARRVEVFDDALRAELEEMGRLMHDALGIGLAAT